MNDSVTQNCFVSYLGTTGSFNSDGTTTISPIIDKKRIESRITEYREACYNVLAGVFSALQRSSLSKRISPYDVEKERLMLENLYYLKWANTLLSKSSEDEVVKKYYEYEYAKASDYEKMHNSKIYVYEVFKNSIVEKWEARKRLDEDEEAYFQSLETGLHNDTEYDELEKNITKIESEIPCLYEKLKSLSESLAEITNEYIRNSADPLRSNELHQKFRNSSMVYAEITYATAEKIREIETLRFRSLKFLPSHKRTQTVLDAMKRFAIL
ncbi:hypothetical protein MS3_00010409 [Schistosoma haematobium]|uniref:Uncharacterized protein n=1 Tax=Schistosoma haematobium TaxID=6185 RepID=A0A922S352_SCHHA|nr:hypothetical protein MS3_00010409 [Schistosoma haematobium]KAH9591501.1 hypothetical protein MS3_00010409 [Schistosoma haematobium]